MKKIEIYKHYYQNAIHHYIMNALPNDIQTLIWKMYFTNICLDELHKVIKKTKNDNIILLHCMSSYPSNHKDYNLRMMLKLKDKFNLHVGLSDHSKGDEVALAATALGAKVIEKHIKLKGDNQSHDLHFPL